MAGETFKSRWRQVLRYALGASLCLLTAVATRAGMQWYWSVVILCGAFLILLGRRRIFRPGLTRTQDEIVCRYIPWFEGNAYFVNVALPLMAVAMVAAGYAPGNPAWLRYGGFVLLGLTPLLVFSAASMWRRCFLRISPSSLVVRLAAPKDGPIVIRHELVESIAPKVVPNSVNGIPSLQTEIAYRTVESGGDEVKTVVLGLQLSVVPINLLNALAYWQDGAHDDPRELMDRIELILRGRAMAGG